MIQYSLPSLWIIYVIPSQSFFPILQSFLERFVSWRTLDVIRSITWNNIRSITGIILSYRTLVHLNIRRDTSTLPLELILLLLLLLSIIRLRPSSNHWNRFIILPLRWIQRSLLIFCFLFLQNLLHKILNLSLFLSLWWCNWYN